METGHAKTTNEKSNENTKDALEAKSGETSQTPELRQVIRQLGLKVTGQRLVILEMLIHGRPHVTAQEVFELAAKKAPEIGFATVYRFLRQLADAGYVSEVRMGGLPARYEWALKKHHDHISCVKCQKIYEFENIEIERLQEEVARKLGFRLTGHVLELFGLCPDCVDRGTLPGCSSNH